MIVKGLLIDLKSIITFEKDDIVLKYSKMKHTLEEYIKHNKTSRYNYLLNTLISRIIFIFDEAYIYPSKLELLRNEFKEQKHKY